MASAATIINTTAKIIGKVLKVLSYIVLGVVGLVVVILIAVNFLLQTGFFTEFVLAQALPPVEEAICANIEVEKLRLSIIPFSLQIEGAVFTDPEGKFDYPFATLDRLTVKVKTAPLLTGKVVAKTVSIEGATNYLYIGDGLENLPICPSEPKKEEEEKPESDEPFKLKLPIEVEDLHVDAVFRMDMPSRTPKPTPEEPEPQPSTPLSLAVASINLDGEADLNSGDAKVALRVGGVDFAMGEMRETVESIALDAEANLQDWYAKVPQLAIRIPGVTLDATASATDLLGEMDVEADLDLAAELRKINQLVLTKPDDIQLAGLLKLAAKYKMKLGKDKFMYVVDGTLDMPSGRVNELALRDLGAAFTLTPEHAKLPRFHLGVGAGAIDLTAKVGLKNSMPLNAKVNVAGLDVGDSLNRFGLKDLPVAGVLDAELSADGPLKPLSLETLGTIGLVQAGFGEIKVKQVDVNLDANVGTKANDVRQLRVAIDDVAVGGSVIDQVNLVLEGVVGPEINKIKTLKLNTPHSEVDITGTANLKGPLDLGVSVTLGDLSEFAGFVGGKKLAGSGALKATVGGTMKNPQVEGNLQFIEVFFDQIEVNSLSAKLGFANKKATVQDLLLESSAAVIRLDASYDMSGEKPLVTAKLSMPQTQINDVLVLAGLAEKLDIDGDVMLEADITGPVDALDGNVTLRADKVEAFKEKIEALTLNARLDGGVVLLDDLTLIKNRGIRPVFHRGMWRPRPETQITEEDRQPAIIKLSGKVDPNAKAFEMKLRSQRLSETASNIVVNERIHAMADLDFTADLAGTFENPEGTLRLAIEHGRYEHLDLGNSTLDVKIEDKQVKVTGVLLDGRRPVLLEGRKKKPVTIAPTGDDEQETPGATEENPTPEDTEDDFAPVDEPGDPDFAPPAGLVFAQAEDAEFAPVATDAQQPASTDEVDLGRINLDLTLGLGEGMPIDAKLVFENFDYAHFLASREQVKQLQRGEQRDEMEEEQQREEIFGGMIRGEILLNGKLGKPKPPEGAPPPADQPLDIKAEVRFDEIMFQRNEFIIKNQNEQRQLTPIVIRYDRGNVSVDSFALGGKGVKIDLAQEQLRGESYFVLTAQVALSVAKSFTTALSDAKGRLDLRAEIPVKFDLDKVVADLEIPRANFIVQNVPTAIEKFKLKVHFAKRTASVEQLSADIGGGKLTGGGTITLPPKKKKREETTPQSVSEMRRRGERPGSSPEEKTKIDLYVRLNNVKTGIDPYIEIALDKVEILVTSRPDGKLDVSGEIDIAKALISYEIDLITLFMMFQKPRGAVQGSEVYEKKEETVFFNIAVHAPRNVGFENSQATIELALDLVLVGSNVSPGMIGTVEVVKGNAQVLQNDYRVTSAVIQFYEETRIFPAFDINAETEVNEIKILINVSGTPERYTISFQSDPPMPEREIFTLLSLGVSYAEFQAGAGAEAAAVALAQQLVVGRAFRSYTGFDFGVDTSTGTSRLKISGELQKDLRLSIFRGISDPTLAAELEYSFIRYIAVYTDWSNFAGQEDVPASGGYGAGVRLKIDFR